MNLRNSYFTLFWNKLNEFREIIDETHSLYNESQYSCTIGHRLKDNGTFDGI